MALHPLLPRSPYEPLVPAHRWFPGDEALRSTVDSATTVEAADLGAALRRVRSRRWSTSTSRARSRRRCRVAAVGRLWTGGYIFENEWQSFRTRQDRGLELKTAPHVYARPGRYQVAVKVIDIFGNDTMTPVPVHVG